MSRWKRSLVILIVLLIAAAVTVGNMERRECWGEAVWEEFRTLEIWDPELKQWVPPDSTFTPPVPTEETKQNSVFQVPCP